ncbi:hypothetical protein Poli38472_011494 [Pythium oligandrum]|uniref:Peptidase S1 domain-containing protein n=1 Tax=Pythium oligandrum TaxID=41045 RepID=A0A8K1CJA8_PYTOL|nr:hypothetical protein Poli38472_011494 [Pythium oligandrum]|eukprot:TMW64614.1 hypothetical protein Poli38472_011494 [Pythium oligandrum]
MLSEPNKWSFLVRQAKNEDQVSLLGLGGHLVTNEDGIWGFSWLPKLLTSSTFLDNGIQGVHTVQTVKKEIVGGRVIEKMDKYTEFIVGLRISEKATSNCTGSLIASRFVLTAAGCWRPLYQFKWAVFNTVATSGKPSEVIAIKQLTRYDSFRAGILGNNVMLIELENASSRRPIAYVSKNDATKMPATITAFDYGAYRKLFVGHWSTILRYKKFKVYNNSDCPADVQRRLDKITVCALDGLCYGDFGSPMVLDAGTDKQKLFAVSGMRSTVLPPVCRSQPSGSAT